MKITVNDLRLGRQLYRVNPESTELEFDSVQILKMERGDIYMDSTSHSYRLLDGGLYRCDMIGEIPDAPMPYQAGRMVFLDLGDARVMQTELRQHYITLAAERVSAATEELARLCEKWEITV